MPGSVSNGLTVVSLFAGCGGSSLGYRMAGYRELLAVEWDAKASATFRRNFPGVPVHEGNICELSGDEALRLAGVAECELDLLDGSPPCQGFSTAGKREFSDGRNRLFEEFARLLRAFRPRAFIMENVSGLRKGKMVLAFAEMTAALKAAGYRVSCHELNAWWYGVPQDRRRLIWVGVREGLGIEPSHPTPMRRKPVTVAEALRSVKVEPWGRDFLDTKTGRNMLKVRPGSCEGTHFCHLKLHPDKPSPTLRHDFLGWFHTWHWQGNRPLRLTEWKVLQGFPEWFQFPKSEAEACPLIGNSVPPPMAEAVGRHVAALLGVADG